MVDTLAARANGRNIRNKSECAKINGVVSVKFERKVTNVYNMRDVDGAFSTDSPQHSVVPPHWARFPLGVH